MNLVVIRERYRAYKQHVAERFRQEPFPTLVIYALFLSLIFLLFAFRGLIITFFIPPIGVEKASPNPGTPSAEGGGEESSSVVR